MVPERIWFFKEEDIIMKSNRYAAMDFLVAIAYGGLAEFSEAAAHVVLGLAVIAAVVMVMSSGIKIAEVYGDEQGKFTFKLVMVKGIVIFVGLIIGHLLMKS